MLAPDGEDLVDSDRRSGGPEAFVSDIGFDETGEVDASDVIDVDVPRSVRQEGTAHLDFSEEGQQRQYNAHDGRIHVAKEELIEPTARGAGVGVDNLAKYEIRQDGVEDKGWL